jgi:hypothetical protein
VAALLPVGKGVHIGDRRHSVICRYCGLETGSGGGHPSQAECIKALHDEIARARELIDNARDKTSGGPTRHDKPLLDRQQTASR